MRLSCLAMLALLGLSTPAVSQPLGLQNVYLQVLDNNPELAAARSAYQARSENISQARAGLLPQLGAAASNSSANTKVKLTGLGQQSAKRHAYSYQANLSQPLFRLDRWYQLQAARADNQQALLELSAVEQNLILRSAEAYFGVLRAADLLAVTQAEEAAYQQHQALAAERFNAGLSDKTDMLQAQAALDAARAQRIRAQQQQDDARQALATLSGQWPQQLATLGELPTHPPQPNQASAWVERALQDNLQLQAMDFARQAAEQDLLTRKAGHAPSLDAIAQHQRGDNDSLGFVNQGMPGMPTYKGHSSQTLIGLQLNIPLYSGGATSSRVRQGRYQLESVQHSQENLRRQVEQAARNLHRAINSDIEQIRARQQAIRSSQSAVEATELGYEVGLRTLVDVLDIRRQLYAATGQYHQARYDYLLNHLRLQQVAGNLSPDSLQALEPFLNGTVTSAANTPVIGMPAPRYLQVPHFQQCLASQQQGSYQTWCLPEQRPDNCPQASWQQLQQLPVGHQVPACRGQDA